MHPPSDGARTRGERSSGPGLSHSRRAARRAAGRLAPRRTHASLAPHARGWLEGVSRRRRQRTTVRGDEAQVIPDLVNREFKAHGPDRPWVADITYIPTWAGFLFLAVVVDVWSRRVVGWSMADHLRTELVLNALNMALEQRKPAAVIHHSDQGCQYTSRVSSARAPLSLRRVQCVRPPTARAPCNGSGFGATRRSVVRAAAAAAADVVVHEPDLAIGDLAARSGGHVVAAAAVVAAALTLAGDLDPAVEPFAADALAGRINAAGGAVAWPTTGKRTCGPRS